MKELGYRKGWRPCPGCSTLTGKRDGCDQYVNDFLSFIVELIPLKTVSLIQASFVQCVVPTGATDVAARIATLNVVGKGMAGIHPLIR